MEGAGRGVWRCPQGGAESDWEPSPAGGVWLVLVLGAPDVPPSCRLGCHDGSRTLKGRVKRSEAEGAAVPSCSGRSWKREVLCAGTSASFVPLSLGRFPPAAVVLRRDLVVSAGSDIQGCPEVQGDHGGGWSLS